MGGTTDKRPIEKRAMLIENDFKDCNIMQVNENKDWAGTLIFWGFKNAI